MATGIHKAEVIDLVADKMGCTRSAAADSLNAVLDSISEGLKGNDRITLVGFGTFEVRKRAARKVRAIAGKNAGNMIDVPEGHRIVFSAGKAMQESVHGERQ